MSGLVEQKACNSWFKLVFSQQVDLSSQIVFRSRLSSEKAGYEGSYCSIKELFVFCTAACNAFLNEYVNKGYCQLYSDISV